MAHSPYHFDWNITPSGLEPPASTESPEQFLEEFSNITVDGLTDEDRIFLPDSNQMAQNIAMSRFGLGNAMTAQKLAGTNNLINMTGGMGVNSMGQGFGRRQSALTQGFRDFNQQQQAQLQENIAGFRSDVLGEQFRYQDALTTALGNLIQSGENDDLTITPSGPPLPSFTTVPTDYQGDSILVNGTRLLWTGSGYALANTPRVNMPIYTGTGG